MRELSSPIQFGFLLIPMPVLIYLGNPAIALLVGAALSLMLNAKIIPSSAKLGKYALQTAIVLLGLKMNASQLIQLSADYSLLVTAYVLSTLGVGYLVGKMVGNDPVSNQLISSGTAICGGTTIASLSPIVNARPDQTAVALTLVFLLNAVALFIYPHIGHFLELSQEQFGIWCALSIHDTSSVVATALSYGEESGAVATTLKLGRTLWLIPLLVIASAMQQREDTKVRLPWFIAFFIASAALGGFVEMPTPVIDTASFTSKALLVLALYCIGSDISRDTLSRFRGSSVVHGLLLWVMVVPATLAMVYFL
jgi:uncharacterized integral membrane protein (TIGR00698 family)